MTSTMTGGAFFFEDAGNAGRNRVVTAPEALPDRIDLFIAGGISGCQDWQRYLLALLGGMGIIVANPRRAGRFDLSDVVEQTALARPDVIVRDGLAALAGDVIRTVGR